MLSGLSQRGITARLHGPSALDRYFGKRSSPVTFVGTDVDVVTLASILDNISFPGIDGVDAAAAVDGHTYWFIADEWLTHPLTAFSYAPGRDAYGDPAGVYPLLRDRRAGRPAPLPPGAGTALEAIMCARYGFLATTTPDHHQTDWSEALFRMVLNQILTADDVETGLDILDREGLLAEYLPDLAAMKETYHSKEGHPEGDVWQHTMETFRYRKDRDYLVALALLLHDVGKPQAVENEGRRFDRHAEIGAGVAGRLLRRIGEPDTTIDSVYWLIRNHMMPGAIERLPPHRRNPVMSSELFPRLLELYRCDLSSTYRGPDGYYRACRVYRQFLKDSANPFRDAAGKKLVRAYVE